MAAIRFRASRCCALLFPVILAVSFLTNLELKGQSLTWNQRFPTSNPSSRTLAGMAYDEARGQVVMFGGDTNSGGTNETWVWNGGTWIKKSPSSAPQARRMDFPLAFDSARQQIVLFGGVSRSGTFFSDTWVWNGTTWIDKTPPPPALSPTAQASFGFAYDANHGQTVLFGGLYFNGSQYVGLNETWVWNGSTWTNVTPSSPAASPGHMYLPAMAYDPTRKQIVLLGGFGAGTNETWVWNGSIWTNVTPSLPSQSPSARGGASLVFDAARNQMMLFGGQTFDGVTLTDTWIWNGNTWSLSPSILSPSGRVYQAMAYDTGRSQAVLFGGNNPAPTILGDTWVWPEVDSDGDGIPDEWELHGVTINGKYIDLPGMGANPNHKDIFVQADWLVKTSQGRLLHTHQPDVEAINAVVKSFLQAPVSNPDGTTGINLHVDLGPQSIMIPTIAGSTISGTQWGTRSRAHGIEEPSTILGSAQSDCTYVWKPSDGKAFDDLKNGSYLSSNTNFPQERRNIFHYSIFAHYLPDVCGRRVIGVSRYNNIDTEVQLGNGDFALGLYRYLDEPPLLKDQYLLKVGAAFMHELGHNLGLHHGGVVLSQNILSLDTHPYKPNYLSVMSYAFLFGLITSDGKGGAIEGLLDYSRVKLPALDEHALDNHAGLGPDAVFRGNPYGTRYKCRSILGNTIQTIGDATQPINWDCGLNISSFVSGDIDGNGKMEVLAASEPDWNYLVFTGGGIGSLSVNPQPDVTAVSEPSSEDYANTPHPNPLCVGDVNGDKVVNNTDLALVRASFGKRVGETGFNGLADINNDGVIDILDLSVVSRNIGCRSR